MFREFAETTAEAELEGTRSPILSDVEVETVSAWIERTAHHMDGPAKGNHAHTHHTPKSQIPSLKSRPTPAHV